MNWEEANDITKEITHIKATLDLVHIDVSRIFCYRSYGSKARAYARTWGFPKIFQRALGVQPAYVIEVLSKYYDKLDDDNKKKILIHELLHIPKNFSGALLPHHHRGGRISIKVNALFKEYKKKLLTKQ